MKFSILIILVIVFCSTANSQSYITRDIKSFGAKGDGKTNDHIAFERAAQFFNSRGGNGKLTISKGVYLIGKQNYTGNIANHAAYEGEDVMHFSNINNFKIAGSNCILKYIDNLRFGAFVPATGQPYEHGKNLFVNRSYLASIENCIYLGNCNNIQISNITIDGNNKHVILGGIYGDMGWQVAHYGIFIYNSKNIIIDNANVHHSALDGICVSNIISDQKDNITISNSSFEYNSRQGLSWIGGNSLLVKNCKFNHTGRGPFYSSPAGGVDIEAESGPIRNGVFENCEFIDNVGICVGADSGDSGDCTFTNCTFWGTTSCPLLISKPGFTFTSCKIYGSFANGYNSPNDKNATKFFSCTFEDKSYNGKEPFGTYLIETNGAKRETFTNCNFIANKKKLCWIDIAFQTSPEERYLFTNCNFIVMHSDYPKGDFVAVMRGARFKDCTFEFKDPQSKLKGHFLDDYEQPLNVDLGGNKVVYAK